MDTLDIKIEGCSTDLIVRSSLETLKVFHDEILRAQNNLAEKSALLEEERKISEKYANQIAELKSQIEKNKQDSQSHQEENRRLTSINSELERQINEAKSEIATLSEKAQISEEKHVKDTIEVKEKLDQEIQQLRDSHCEELSKRDTKEVKLLEANEMLKTQNSDLETKVINLSSIILRLIGRYATQLSQEIHSLITSVESESLRCWMMGILDKGDGSEMKGLDSFDKINSIELLNRNVTFRNSFFSDVATLLLWSSNDEIKNKISPEYDWSNLSRSFDNLLIAMKEANIEISYLESQSDFTWLGSAECTTDKDKQSQFQQFFGHIESIKKNDPIFITSIASDGHPGSYIKFYTK